MNLFNENITSGFYWDMLTKARFSDPLYLERYGYKVYSQNDEDGIIAEIFKRIGTTNKRFIEFGVQDGIESNTHYLLFKEWSGLWIDGDPGVVRSAENKFRPVIDNGQLSIINAFINRDNINSLFEINGLSGEVDLLSIDIDGNDYHVWEAISVISPRVVIIEYNAKFPPDCEWVMAYNEYHTWDNSDKHSASLKSLELLGRELGYQLTGTNINGTNAFFVRCSLASDLFATPSTADNLYNPYRSIRFVSGHPAKVCLKSNAEGMKGLFAYQPEDVVYIAQLGFHPPDYNEDGTTSVQWMSSKNAKIFIRLSKQDLRGIRFRLITGIKTDLLIDLAPFSEKKVHIEQSMFKPFDIVYELPTSLVYNVNDVIEMSLLVDKLWSPDQVLGNKDMRTLGVGIQEITLE